MQRKSRNTLLPLLFAGLLYSAVATAQENITFRVVCWNVENLFDVRHDSLKQDREFLPTSPRRWNYGRYQKKLANVSRVIAALGEWQAPALVGLCEVENENVMRDLTRYSPLKTLDYRYVITNSPDIRGIDVALLYQRDRFKLISSQSLRVRPARKSNRPTRDILHVTGQLLNGDSLDVFVCHFPSRMGGVKKTEPYRLVVAQTLKNAVDSLFTVRLHPQIIIMGDMNDYPRNKSIKDILAATAPPPHPEPNKLYHLLARKTKETKSGSYKYQGVWGLFDHLIVSGSLLIPQSGFFTDESKANVAHLPFLLVKDEKNGGTQPFRTYNGMKYRGGFSDHLPVYVDFMEAPSW
jgi:predicted extracellular nuclease